MNRKALVLSLAFLSLNVSSALTVCFAAQTDSERAHECLTEAVKQMGGETALRALKTVRFEAIGHREMVEQSERPEGPYVVEYDHLIVQLRDLERHHWKQTVTLNGGPFPEVTIDTVTVDESAKRAFDHQVRPGSPDDLQSAQETLELGPERVLFTALAADDLRAEADTVLQSVPHHVVAFTWRNLPVRLYLNSYTALPTEVEWQSAYPSNIFWSAWGDVTTRLYYSLWWLCPGGIHYPTQWDFVRNGLPDRVFTITKIATNVEFPADTFAISADERATFHKRGGTLDDRPLGIPDQPAVEVAKDIVHIPGAWNVTLARQTDGIVIVEAPISSGYSAKVLAEAERRWPGVPVKAVISTSDSWPHLAGVREYVARGIPVYALDLNIAILSRLVTAPRTRFPDAAAQNPKKPDFHVVASKTLLGTGPNRIEIYPLRGETSERQMMVYFPEHKLLYGSDPFQKNERGYTFPQTVWELVHAVERERFSVDTFFMMHIGPTPWGDLLKAIEEAENAPIVKQDRQTN
jgi:hypothetical protein